MQDLYNFERVIPHITLSTLGIVLKLHFAPKNAGLSKVDISSDFASLERFLHPTFFNLCGPINLLLGLNYNNPIILQSTNDE